MVQVISINKIRAVNSLRNTWQSKQTFCLVNSADKTASALSSLVNLVPKSLQYGHFGVFTSGSTSDSSLVIGEKARAEKLVKLIHIAQKLEPIKETLCLLPLSYSYAFINQWLWSLTFNRRFVLTPGFSKPDELANSLATADNAMLCLVASQLPLFQKCFSNASFTGVTRINFAGERFPQEQMKFLTALFPNAEIFNNYGCTEAMPRISVREAQICDDPLNIGKPLPNIELQTDSNHNILFRSPYSAVASINSEGVTSYRDSKWITTGDIGELLPNGTWRLEGRSNSIFKRFGEKVSITRVINSLRQTWPRHITGYIDVDANGAQSWVVLLAPDPQRLEVRALLKTLRFNYTRAHWPIRIESVAQIPTLSNGKIDIQALKDAEGKKLHWRQRI